MDELALNNNHSLTSYKSVALNNNHSLTTYFQIRGRSAREELAPIKLRETSDTHSLLTFRLEGEVPGKSWRP